MSETFEKILVKDDRLGCITPKVKVSSVEGRAEHHLSDVQGNIAEHVKSRVQRGGSESGDNH